MAPLSFFEQHARVVAFLSLICIQTGAHRLHATSRDIEARLYSRRCCPTRTGVALLFKLSQKNGKYTFSPGSAQTTAEAAKLLISAAFFTRDTLAARRDAVITPDADAEQPETPSPPALSADAASVVAAFRAQVDARLLRHTCGLSLLYCFNNQLAFALFRWADAATVTLIKSASSFVSAILLWLLLSRPIAPLQWIAILLQVLGLFIVQYDDCKHAVLLALPIYFALFVSLFISSAAGVWNEHVLKTFKVTMHVQNCCLYVFGVGMNLAVFCFFEKRDKRVPLHSAYFAGYNAPALGIIFCQAVLGLVITLVLKYADMVIRSFATACSISVLYAVNVLFLGWVTNLTYLAGCAVVFLATYMYMALGAAAATSAVASAPTVVPTAEDAAAVESAAAKQGAEAEGGHDAWLARSTSAVAVSAALLVATAVFTYWLSSSSDWGGT
jgi:UDP-sugar transporter A1/2/3